MDYRIEEIIGDCIKKDLRLYAYPIGNLVDKNFGITIEVLWKENLVTSTTIDLISD